MTITITIIIFNFTLQIKSIVFFIAIIFFQFNNINNNEYIIIIIIIIILCQNQARGSAGQNILDLADMPCYI